MTSSPPVRAIRSPDEIRATIEVFTDLEWHRVRKAAEYWARAHGADADDVMQDALERAVDGSRQCPRDISIFAFLSGAMRSISGDERKARTRRAEIHLVAEDGSLVVDPMDDRHATTRRKPPSSRGRPPKGLNRRCWVCLKTISPLKPLLKATWTALKEKNCAI